jgi:hypothetical protein
MVNLTPFGSELLNLTNSTTQLNILSVCRAADWGLGAGKQPFLSCPISNCYVTEDARYVERFGQFDAVLFHLENIVCPFADPTHLRMFRWPHQR